MRFLVLYTRGLRTSIRNNSAAYGFSVLMTTSFAALTSLAGAPALGELFLFVLGASVAFTGIEVVASRSFRDQMRGEPSEVVVLGSAMNVFSISLGLGTAAVAGLMVTSWVAWPVASFGATAVYLLVAAVELGLAARAEKRG